MIDGAAPGRSRSRESDLCQGYGEPLMRWASAVEGAEWSNPAELRQQFGSADFVSGLTVFDIGGNKFRLIAYVNYRKHFVVIKRILTHADYDKGAWKK